jgi:ElaB/YqjD/DUF883 family membrane-anchored ribosome-binding protein
LTPAADQRTPEQLRAEIEVTRQQLGDTVEALAARTDFKTRTKERFAALRSDASARTNELVARTREATPESAEAKGQQLTATVKANPIPFAAAGALAAGLLIGVLIGRRKSR